ncbi:Nitroreductase [Janibacter sp. HTCC2649]|uniref:nitroreductase n=1 Tax=Janibacter sp. HTCC2649 TaxID=313589 RepID=UPI0000670B39|nr:nitroreductase [Janibacter sp. HTCC2649]EAQ00636.1 Nitroreductase [Janibacter sp. HTCC2649]
MAEPSAPVDVWEAVAGRRSTRAFTAEPVDRAVLVRALSSASRAPSGGNLQPWHVDVVAGQSRDALVESVLARLERGEPPPEAEYAVYPPSLWSPHRERRFTNGEQLYAALDIAREDRSLRLVQFARNWEFFGAPVGAFITVDRRMGAAQWSDLGGFIQTLLLLLHAEGLGTCAQEAWSVHHDLVTREIGTPAQRMLFCGIAIGHPDPNSSVNRWTSDRVPLDEFTTFH